MRAEGCIRTMRCLRMPDASGGIEKCVWRIIYESPGNTSFNGVTEGHELYRCVYCEGRDDGCIYYVTKKTQPIYLDQPLIEPK